MSVGDRPKDILAPLRFVADAGCELRSTSGGRGATAETGPQRCGRFAGVDLVPNEPMRARIAEIVAGWAARSGYDGAALEAANRKQSMLPRGAVALDPVGTAPGVVVSRPGGPLVIVLPGPPRELQGMWPAALAAEPLRTCWPGCRRGVRSLRYPGCPSRRSRPPARLVARGTCPGSGDDLPAPLRAEATCAQDRGPRLWRRAHSAWPPPRPQLISDDGTAPRAAGPVAAGARGTVATGVVHRGHAASRLRPRGILGLRRGGGGYSNAADGSLVTLGVIATQAGSPRGAGAADGAGHGSGPTSGRHHRGGRPGRRTRPACRLRCLASAPGRLRSARDRSSRHPGRHPGNAPPTPACTAAPPGRARDPGRPRQPVPGTVTAVASPAPVREPSGGGAGGNLR